MRLPFRTSCGVLAMLAVGGLRGEVVTIEPVADTCLFEWTANYNFGAQVDLPAGGLGGMAGSERLARSLFKFDVAGAVPAGALITGARMRLHVTMAPDPFPRDSDFALNRVLVDWGEGAKDGERPGGAVATAGEASWDRRFHPDVAWSSPGGVFGVDFATAQSAVKDEVMLPGDYIFEFNATGVADVQAMLDDPASNFGWVLHSLNEGETKTARRWASREAATDRPELEITWIKPVISSVDLSNGGADFVVRVEGVSGYRYQVETSSDLASWLPGEVQVPSVDGELEFITPRNEVGYVRVVATPLP